MKFRDYCGIIKLSKYKQVKDGGFMALTHVAMWNNGWKDITIEEAIKLHPGGLVSAKSGLFMCKLCHQNVMLTDGRIYRRYF